MKTKFKLLMLSASGIIAILFAVIAGCSDTTTNPNPVYVNNPNVKSFDSIGVAEDSIITSITSLNLFSGTSTNGLDANRDCSLNDQNNAGINFFLQNGQLLSGDMPAGYEIRFFRVDANMNASVFDTLSRVPGYTSFSSTDFTQDGTEFWGYFNAPLSSTPVYCFWLKGRRDAGITPLSVYGIIQPREATDYDPLNSYGFRMSFRVRINTKAENDFRKQILQ